MWILAIGLLILVVHAAKKAPDDPDSTAVPINDQPPAVGAVGNPSPATANGRPGISRMNRTILGSTFDTLPGTPDAGHGPPAIPSRRLVSRPSSSVADTGRQLMTQTMPPQVNFAPRINPALDHRKL